MMKKRLLVCLLALALLLTLAPRAELSALAEETRPPLIGPEEEVLEAVDYGSTRLEISEMLYHMAGEPEVSFEDNPYADVADLSDYERDAVMYVTYNGIMSGTGPSAFSPNSLITRAQAVAYLHAAMGKPASEGSENPYTDVQPGKYYYNAVLWALGESDRIDLCAPGNVFNTGSTASVQLYRVSDGEGGSRWKVRIGYGTSGSCGGGFEWSFDSDTGVLTVTGAGELYFTGVSSPWFPFSDSITAISLPEGLTGIPDEAFKGLAGVTELTLPESLLYIGYSAFEGLSSLKEITIPKSVYFVGPDAFAGCTGLERMTVLHPYCNLFYGESGVPGTMVVRGYEDSSAALCAAYLGYEFESLGEIDFTIGGSCGAEGDNLTWTFSSGTRSLVIEGAGDMADYSSDNYGCAPWRVCSPDLDAVVLPEGLTGIGDFAFADLRNLLSIAIPEAVTSIGASAFAGSGITGVSIPGSVTSLGDNAFRGCPNLTELLIPDNIRRIPRYLCYRCSNLSQVTLSAGVEAVESGAFMSCYKLNAVVIRNPGCRVATDYIQYDFHDTAEDLPNPSWEEEYGVSGSLGVSGKTILYAEEPAEPAEPYLEDYEQGCRLASLSAYAKRFGFPLYRLGAFSDVKAGSYYEIPVAWAVGKGITSGTGTETFSPKKTCTREQIVTFLWIACGSPEPETTENPFTDVKETKYYYKPVLWAVENGITTGTGADTFGVGRECTRSQVMSFLWTAAGSPEPVTTENPFTDVKPTAYYYKAVLWAVENGVTTGLSASAFGPKATCTRGQIVTFLYKTAALGFFDDEPEPVDTEEDLVLPVY